MFLVFASQSGRSLAESPENVISPEQYSAAERQHEQEIIAAKKVETRDEEALRVSMEQLREVGTLYAYSFHVHLFVLLLLSFFS